MRNIAPNSNPTPEAHKPSFVLEAIFALEWGKVVNKVTTVCPVPVTVEGLKSQELSAGKPLHAKLAVPAYPDCPSRLIINVPPEPLGTFTVLADGNKAKSFPATATEVLLERPPE